MNPLIAIVGPTATGKSKLAIELAREFNGGIVSADSRQVYRYMDIGTAKPDRRELSLIPHHLIDIKNPDEDFSLAEYKELASTAIDGIRECGKIPFLTGGSGLYVWALIEGWGIPEVEPDPEFRRQLEEKAAEGGADELYRELVETDPEAAESIDPRNVRRVIRALEVTRQAGKTFSGMKSRGAAPDDTLIIGLTTDRQELYRRIDGRVDAMIENGLIEEVQKLLNMGYKPDLPAMSGIGYGQICSYLHGEMTFESAVSRIKTETHRLVRRQYNWFKLNDKRIHWFDIQEDFEPGIKKLIGGFIF